MEKNVQLTIKGTHCPACKRLIERKISAIAGVISVNVNFETGETEIKTNRDISKNEIQQSLEGMEYQII